MHAKLKPLSEQVVVVTGAAAGIGLTIARRAAEAGASVMLVGRDEAAIRQAAADITKRGGRAHPVAGDATDAAQAARLARTAVARFGGFDSWINVAETEAAMANSAREAAKHFAERGGGAVVNLAAEGAEAAPGLGRELRKLGPAVLSSIRLPGGWSAAEGLPAAAEAALYAAAHSAGRMSVVPGGRLTVYSQAQKHRALIVGAGVVALAAVAGWYFRGELEHAVRRELKRRGPIALPRRGAWPIFTTP